MSFESCISSIQSLSHVRLFATPWITAHEASLSITNSYSLLKLMSIESVMPSNHLILCCPLFLLPSIFPESGSFPMSQFCASDDQKFWSLSFSMSPSNEYSGLISLKSKGLSKVFSNITVQKHQFFSTQFSLWSNSHIHTWLLAKQ